MEEVSVYIHIPYCKSKCGYCDFNSYPGREDEYEGYVEALLRELKQRGRQISGAAVPSIFFGGGTPSILGAELLSLILSRCKEVFTLDPRAEISIEANPETLSPSLLRDLLDAGFNRLSVGIQSFDDSSLQRLGRNHSGTQAVDVARQAAGAGFENISLDLMFGVPGQEIPQWEEDVEKALSLHPTHVSAYGLKVEEKTPFDRLLKMGLITLPDEETFTRMYTVAVEKLNGAGYEHYEIANFALPGYRCLHNVNYWRNGPYLGLGAGAHSYLKGERSANVRDPAEYLARVAEESQAVDSREKLPSRSALGEALMLGLRLTEGIDVEEYGARYGADLRLEYGPVIRDLSQQGLLEMEGTRLKLTWKGILLSDEVFLKLL